MRAPVPSAMSLLPLRASAAAGLLLALGTATVAFAPVASAAQPTVTHADSVRVQSMASELRRLRDCESGGRYSTDTGNGYYGAYQFSAATWHGLGYGGLPSSASTAVQDAAAARLWSADGPRPWGGCGSFAARA